jgi:hypothetical protein
MVAISTTYRLILGLFLLIIGVTMLTTAGDALYKWFGINLERDINKTIEPTSGILKVTRSSNEYTFSLSDFAVYYRGEEKNVYIVFFWQGSVFSKGDTSTLYDSMESDEGSNFPDIEMTIRAKQLVSLSGGGVEYVYPEKGNLIIGFFEKNEKCLNMAKVDTYPQYMREDAGDLLEYWFCHTKESEFSAKCAKFLVGTINVIADTQNSGGTNLNSIPGE